MIESENSTQPNQQDNKMALVTTICEYNGKRLSPAPLVSIQAERFFGSVVGPNDLIGAQWAVTLNGTIVPTGSGGTTFTDPAYGVLNVFKEKNEIFSAFTPSNQKFTAEVSGSCNGFMISGYPAVKSITMDDSTDNFTQTASYTVELIFPSTTIGFLDIVSGAYGLESITTNYSTSNEKLPFTYLNERQGGIQTLTRTISAKGLDTQTGIDPLEVPPIGLRPAPIQSALMNAAAYVASNAGGCPNISGIGFPSGDPPAGVFITGENVDCFLQNRTQDWDPVEGSFSQTDTFLRMDSSGTDFNSSGNPVRDEYTWDVSYDWSAGGINTLSINGTVQGFAAFEPAAIFSGQATTAIANAENYLTIAQTGRIEFIKSVASGRAVHPAIGYNLQSANINTNPVEGSIGYSYTYVTQAPLNTGVLSETINVTRTNPSQVFAELQVLGRALGPVLQDIGTQTAYSEELSIEAVVLPQPGDSGVALSAGGEYEPFNGAPDYQKIVNSHEKAISGRFGDDIAIFKTNDSESFDVKTGRYTRNVGYIYTECPS